MKALSILTVVFFMIVSNAAFAENKEKIAIDKDAAIAGGTAAGATVVGAGVAASTVSAATITGTIAAIGGGSMAVGIGVVAAVPILVGGAVYGILLVGYR